MRELLFRLLRLNRLVLILIILILVPALVYFFLILLEPTSKPQNVLISNVSDHQAAVTWTTAQPTRGLIILSEDGKFPLLPILARQVYKDDGEKDLSGMRFYSTHHLTIDNIKPGTVYQYNIYQGWKKVYHGSFKTGPTLSSIAAPNPVYGKVLAVDRKTPLVGVIVYLQAKTGKEKSAILSALTNSKGGWTIDLANLRSADLKTVFPLNKESSEIAVVDGGSLGRVKAQIGVGHDNPWPDLVLNPRSRQEEQQIREQISSPGAKLKTATGSGKKK